MGAKLPGTCALQLALALVLMPLQVHAADSGGAAQSLSPPLTIRCFNCEDLVNQSSQPAAATKTITTLGFRQLLEIAVETHPSVRGAKLEQQAAQSLIEAARQQFWPAPGVQADSSSGRTALVLSLTQPLWTGGRLTADLRLSELSELRAREQISESKIALATRLTNVGQTFLSYKGRRIAQERSIKTLLDLLRMIEQRSRSEVSAMADVNLVRTRLAQAQADLELIRAQEGSALAQLASAINQPLQADSIEISQPPGTRLLLEPLLEKALQNNPRLRIAEVDTRLAAVEVDRARAAMFPTVSLRVQRQFGENAVSVQAGTRVLLSMQYAPGSGFSVASQVAAAEQRVLAVQSTSEADRQDLAERVQTEWRDFESSHARIEELRKSRAGATAALESSRRLFVAGRRSWIDLLNSVREIGQAEQAEADALAVRAFSYYRLGLLMGLHMWSNESERP